MPAAIRTLGALLVSAMVLAPVAGPAQSADGMIVIVPGDKQFHQPGCPVVARAGSKVQVAKRSEATRRGLTPHDACAGGGDGNGAPAGDPNQEKVYTQADDNKYHRKDCAKLGDDPKAIALEDAGRKFWPCPVCEPPIRQRKAKQEGE